MAVFRIAEFQHSNHEGTVANLDSLLAVQRFTISGTSAQSNNLNAATRYVGVYSDVACVFKKGSNPTAADATDNLPLPANQWHYFIVDSVGKIAAITI